MPDEPRLSRLDLNLLVALDALLGERSVTRAAERLHLSQPALSASLARLRTHFDDRLLVRRGNASELTPLARRLAGRTSTALDAALRVFDSRTSWDPATATREFSVYGSDHAFATVGRRASLIAEREAPHVTLRFLLHNEDIVEHAAERLRTVDAMIIPHGFVRGRSHLDLWREDWVLVVADDNASAARGIRLDDLAEAKWVYTYQSRSAFTPAGRQLEQLGISPDVVAVVESFLALPAFVVGTERLGLVHRSLTSYITRVEGVRVVEPPFEVTPILNALWWDPANDDDPEHAWLRDVFARAGREVAESMAAPA